MDALQPLRLIWSDEPKRYLLLLVLFAAFYSYAFVGGPAPVRPLEVGAAPAGGPLTVYFFHLAGCSHCRAQIDFNQRLADEFPSVEWKYYEVSSAGARAVMEQMVAERNATVTGVPVTIIGNSVVNGFDENTIGPRLRSLIWAELDNKTTAVGNATGNNSDCDACKLPAAQIFMLPIFGPITDAQMHPLLLSAMAGLGQAVGPCAAMLLAFWAAMGLVSGRSRAVQLTGIAFGAASAAIGLLFLLKWLDPHPLLLGWRAAGIILGAFALFWGLHELDEIRKGGKEKKPDAHPLGAVFIAGVIMAGVLAIPITAAAFVCAGPLNEGIIRATAQAPEQLLYLFMYAVVYAVSPLILFAIVYLAAFGHFGKRVELVARLIGILMLLAMAGILLVRPTLLQI